jgi:hypothetical protein
VGHSLGGLIARYYVQRLGGDARVDLVVTVATPHRGTMAAWLLPPLPLARQLRPDSALYAELAEPAPECRTRFVTFSSGGDAVIVPARNGQLDHPDLPTRNVVLPGMGHFTLADHRLVLDEICQLLAASSATQRHDGRPIVRASWPRHRRVATGSRPGEPERVDVVDGVSWVPVSGPTMALPRMVQLDPVSASMNWLRRRGGSAATVDDGVERACGRPPIWRAST